MSEKPMGNASVEIQTGTPTAMMSPAARSVVTSAIPPTANMAAMAAPATAPTRWAMLAGLSLGKELARGEREQLSLARRDGGAEQSDPERQVQRERSRARNTSLDELPHRDLGERQQHDAAERDRGNDVLGSCRERRHYFLVFLNASRSRAAAS